MFDKTIYYILQSERCEVQLYVHCMIYISQIFPILNYLSTTKNPNFNLCLYKLYCPPYLSNTLPISALMITFFFKKKTQCFYRLANQNMCNRNLLQTCSWLAWSWANIWAASIEENLSSSLFLSSVTIDKRDETVCSSFSSCKKSIISLSMNNK